MSMCRLRRCIGNASGLYDLLADLLMIRKDFIIKGLKCVKPMLSFIAIFNVDGVCLHC